MSKALGLTPSTTKMLKRKFKNEKKKGPRKEAEE
jgi:hypothetical protein